MNVECLSRTCFPNYLPKIKKRVLIQSLNNAFYADFINPINVFHDGLSYQELLLSQKIVTGKVDEEEGIRAPKGFLCHLVSDMHCDKTESFCLINQNV